MRFDFGNISIDCSRREIRQGGEIVSVEPKVFDLIVYFVRNAARVVSKDELVEAIWDGRAISESTLSSCIKAARRALGDTGRTQQVIKTFHKRGFRFVGVLKMNDSTASVRPAAEPLSPDDIHSDDLEGIDLTLPQQPSIAILPFSTFDQHGGQNVLASGLVGDLTTRLAQTRWLFVTARASAGRFHVQSSDVATIGRALGVRYLLCGSVIRSADRFRLTATLSDAEQGQEIWAARFDRSIDDLFAVQDEICDLVAAAVEAEIELKERQKALLKPFASLDAWSAYHRANDCLYRFSPDEHDQAEHLFQLAAKADPASSRIFAGLSFLHWQRAFFEVGRDRDSEIASATEYGQHSVSLDPFDPAARWVLGRTALLKGDLDLAVDELAAAVDLNPNFARAHFSLGYGNLFRGAIADVIVSAARARRISPYDPMSFAYLSLYAEANVLAGEYGEATTWAKRAARQRNAHYHIAAVAAWCHELAGDHEAALGYAARLRQLRPDYSCAEFFRAYPYEAPMRGRISDALSKLGF